VKNKILVIGNSRPAVGHLGLFSLKTDLREIRKVFLPHERHSHGHMRIMTSSFSTRSRFHNLLRPHYYAKTAILKFLLLALLAPFSMDNSSALECKPCPAVIKQKALFLLNTWGIFRSAVLEFTEKYDFIARALSPASVSSLASYHHEPPDFLGDQAYSRPHSPFPPCFLSYTLRMEITGSWAWELQLFNRPLALRGHLTSFL